MLKSFGGLPRDRHSPSANSVAGEPLADGSGSQRAATTPRLTPDVSEESVMPSSVRCLPASRGRSGQEKVVRAQRKSEFEREFDEVFAHSASLLSVTP